MPPRVTGTIGIDRGVGLPALCLAGWTLRRSATRVAPNAGAARWASTRRSHCAPYEGAIKDLCLQLKHERNAWLAPWLGDLLVEGRREAISRLPEDAWVVPVPLHWWRHWRRGYNQAEALARSLAKGLGLPIHRPLRRVKATPRLAQKGITERSELMHKAFRARSSPQLKGRTVLLVDDILTTGATCGEAAKSSSGLAPLGSSPWSLRELRENPRRSG